MNSKIGATISQSGTAVMSDEQIRALWEKTDSHATVIGSLSERTKLLEHRSRVAEENIQRLLESSEASDKALRNEVRALNETVLSILKAHSEAQGVRSAIAGFAKIGVPVIVAGLAGLVWLIQTVVKP